jgi:hypothetical protein
VTGDTTAGDALDLQDVGAEPGEHLRARRAGLNSGEVDDLDSGERQFGGLWCEELARRRVDDPPQGRAARGHVDDLTENGGWMSG